MACRKAAGMSVQKKDAVTSVRLARWDCTEKLVNSIGLVDCHSDPLAHVAEMCFTLAWPYALDKAGAHHGQCKRELEPCPSNPAALGF